MNVTQMPLKLLNMFLHRLSTPLSLSHLNANRRQRQLQTNAKADANANSKPDAKPGGPRARRHLQARPHFRPNARPDANANF